MAQTPSGTATPYCTATQLLTFHDPGQCADYLRDGDGPRPTRMALTDPTSDAGAMLLSIMLAASGELESACQVGNRYSAADLAALTNSGAGRLRKLVADLAFWTLAQRRTPQSANPESVPGAKQALAELDRLRSGERIFSFEESGDAGLPETVTPDPSLNVAGDAVIRASRLFGDHRSGYGDCGRRG